MPAPCREEAEARGVFLSIESLSADPGCCLRWEGDGSWVSGQTGLALHPKSQRGPAGLLQPSLAKTLLQGRGRRDRCHPSPAQKVSADDARRG